MKKAVVILSSVLVLSVPVLAAAQAGAGSGSGSGSGKGDQSTSKAVTEKAAEVQAAKTKSEEVVNPRFVRTLTNVQIELTLTDQIGSATPDKKTVSMVVSSGNWGKIRSAGNVSAIGEMPTVVDLNVDARPFVAVDGPIQLELTIVYAPAKASVNDREPAKAQPVRVNQSLTVVLQSGKPLVISQAADPVSDRKVVVEVKATVLKP